MKNKTTHIVKAVMRTGNRKSGNAYIEKYTEYDNYDDAKWYYDQMEKMKGGVMKSVRMYKVVEVM